MSIEDETCPTILLFRRWQDGDEIAFASIERRLRPGLIGGVRRHRLWGVLQKYVEVEDVVQRVWERALPVVQRKYEDRGRNSLLVYLTPFIDYEVRDQLRRASARKCGDPTSWKTDFESVARPPGRSASGTPTAAARISEFMQLAQDQLSEDEFTAWELVAVEGYSAEEVGSDLGRSAAAVRGLVLRARKRLQLAWAKSLGNHERGGSGLRRES